VFRAGTRFEIVQSHKKFNQAATISGAFGAATFLKGRPREV
jgi:hypothetical protein